MRTAFKKIRGEALNLIHVYVGGGGYGMNAQARIVALLGRG